MHGDKERKIMKKLATNEIPSGVPVILHCGAGVVSVPAYETLMEKRKDIPQLSYIAGHPPVDEFNKWLEDHENKGESEHDGA